MTRTRYIPSFALVIGLLFGFAPGARCQEEGGQPAAPVKREHPDLLFARSLGYGWQWYDLAFQVLDDLEASRPAADVLEKTQLLRAELWRGLGSSHKEADKRT